MFEFWDCFSDMFLHFLFIYLPCYVIFLRGTIWKIRNLLTLVWHHEVPRVKRGSQLVCYSCETLNNRLIPGGWLEKPFLVGTWIDFILWEGECWMDLSRRGLEEPCQRCLERSAPKELGCTFPGGAWINHLWGCRLDRLFLEGFGMTSLERPGCTCSSGVVYRPPPVRWCVQT